MVLVKSKLQNRLFQLKLFGLKPLDKFLHQPYK